MTMMTLIVVLVITILLVAGVLAVRKLAAGAPRRRIVRELAVAGFKPDTVEWALDQPAWLTEALLVLPAGQGWEPHSAWNGFDLAAVKGRRGFEDPRDVPEGKEWAAWSAAAHAWRRFAPPTTIEITPATPCVAGTVLVVGMPCSDSRHPAESNPWCPCLSAGGEGCTDYRDVEVPVSCTNHSWAEHNRVLPHVWGEWLTPPRT
jgi:hypothetical protein